MKVMPRAKPVLSQLPRSVAARFVVGDGEERERTDAHAHARISSNPTDSRGMIAIADIREHRIQSERSRILASKLRRG
jgi:hypothetical protein